MENKNDIKLGYDDISIIPEKYTMINHRDECFCFNNEPFTLPIFTAPMDGVVDEKSAKTYKQNLINVVLPRTIDYNRRISIMLSSFNDNKMFISFSLSEVKEMFLDDVMDLDNNSIILRIRRNLNSALFYGSYRICIDLANGHMFSLIETIRLIKELYGSKVIIMSGNIANPETYIKYEESGCDFVRCSIGSGSRCTTSSNTGIHYGCFSLLKEIWEIKEKNNCKCKIIADGGIKGYGDIQKALIYADYVMIGGLFNKAIDSAGIPTYGKSYWNIFGSKVLNPFKTLLTYGKKVKEKDYKKVLSLIKKGKLDVWKEYYGMSTKIAQSKMNQNAKLKTSEGRTERQKVEYTIKQWSDNEIDYLRSAMSYTNSKDLNEYKNSKWVQLLYKSYNK